MRFLNLVSFLSTTTLALTTGLDERHANENALIARAATVCGSGYKLQDAIPLPEGTEPSMRLATLYSYQGNGKGCLILDNNVGESQYMYLRVCKYDDTNCDKDSGSFSQYAGPVYIESFACAPVVAKMGDSSSKLYIDFEDEYVFPCN
ncbi:hypothetical protein FE257_002087 [Aspergillus nanangensis]|uniref:Uncharacterized protein n=1 Tax=Aspergillus nanangensis TaxID=2582783 RepID=A0AAD4CTB1_ASPNN|nr:hypothetical protein FE257_002087 [Aspergillus nanangensis]